ncbi:hypothetical protein AK812_SmicGene13727 [Symbiodinium microadriaticum]|uniref:Uncharacterized protein n=1 Tax=Symbiodinium microadriaticum TaxID=2951 RepID=A0A1Q9E7C3_SYMMI|nr:hypothetical protein AK812_SmicGene13727 [Symbiodinium microadriaticum]
MEKYRQFADGGTGVNPFVPVWSHHKALLPLALLRLCMVATAFLWLVLAELLCWPLGFLPIVRRPLHWLLSYAGCSLALLGLGFWFTAGGHVLADHRRLKLAPPKVHWLFPWSDVKLTLALLRQVNNVMRVGGIHCRGTLQATVVKGKPVPESMVLLRFWEASQKKGYTKATKKLQPQAAFTKIDPCGAEMRGNSGIVLQ